MPTSEQLAFRSAQAVLATDLTAIDFVREFVARCFLRNPIVQDSKSPIDSAIRNLEVDYSVRGEALAVSAPILHP